MVDGYKRRGVASRMLRHFEATEAKEAAYFGSSDGGAS